MDKLDEAAKALGDTLRDAMNEELAEAKKDQKDAVVSTLQHASRAYGDLARMYDSGELDITALATNLTVAQEAVDILTAKVAARALLEVFLPGGGE